MKSIDDSMLGAARTQQAKSRANAGALQGDAKSKSEFDDAFANAGKKKQPLVQLTSGKDADTATVEKMDISATNEPDKPASRVRVASKTEGQTFSHVAANRTATQAGSAQTSVLSAGNALDDSLLAVADGPPDAVSGHSEDRWQTRPRTANTIDSPARTRTALTARDVPDKNVPHGRTAAADAGDIIELDSDDRIMSRADDRAPIGPMSDADKARGKEGKPIPGLEIIKDARTKTDKTPADAKTDKAATKVHARAADPESKPKAETDDAADAGADPTSSQLGVSQLLTLLAPSQTAVATSALPRGEAAIPALSEFQALADRAVKPKSAESATETAEPDADTQAIANATGADRTFHFARADGKGQAVSMKVTADGERTVSNADANAAAKAETVTVLEARRYLGLPANSNAFAITNAIARDPVASAPVATTAAASSSPVQSSTGKVLNTLKIQMHPIDLGLVTATLRLKDDELHVDLKVETGDAFRQLSDDQNEMVKALRAQGFAVEEINIVFNAPDTSSNGSAPQGQGQSAPQGRDAAGDGTGQGRGQRSSDSSGQQQRGSERWTGNEGGVDPSGSSDTGRTGDVYI